MNNESQQEAKLGSSEQVVSSKTQNITSFEDDTVGMVGGPDAPSSVPLVDFMNLPGSDSIIEFLERPTLLASGNLTTSDSTTLYSADPLYSLITGAKAPKLAGIYGIKADLEITITVNATRFQSGRYILAFVPSGGVPISSANFVAYNKMHATTLTNITQLPHVELDLASETHATLSLPWMSVVPFFVNLSTYPVGFGSLFLYPYAALAAASGDTTAGYSLWAAMKNISLVGPTYTQSGRISRKEADRVGKGPVETILSKVSMAANIVGEVPMIAPAARAVSWTTDILARAAHVFGWSKPRDMSAPMQVREHQLRFYENVDGISTAKTLAAVSTNAVDAIPQNVASTIDEMSYDYIKQKYAYFTSVTWSNTLTVGSQIYAPYVQPMNTYTYGSGFIPTPVAFLALQHELWRGSIKFKFKFVKNEFYSGRLMFSYEPNYLATNISSLIASTEFDRRLIVDIRDTNEVEVVCPYISPFLYQGVTEPVGHLIVTVLDPLVAPSTVPSSIVVLVEVAGGPDLEFASPTPLTIEPWAPFTTQSGRVSTVLGSATKPESMEPSAICIGENLRSLRQLWKLPSPAFAVGADNRITITAQKLSLMNPFYAQTVQQSTSISTALTRAFFYGDRMDLIQSCYMAVTGSVRCVVLNYSHTILDVGRLSSTAGNSIFTSNNHNLASGDEIRIPVDTNVEPFDIVMTPYQKTMGRSIVGSTVGSGLNPLSDFSSYNTLSFSPITNSTISVRRTPCDDMNCWGFVSCPALVYRTQT